MQEILELCRPIADACVYKVLNSYLANDETQQWGLMGWVAIFAASLFLDEENRQGARFTVRIAFVSVVVLLVLYEVWSRHLKRMEEVAEADAIRNYL